MDELAPVIALLTVSNNGQLLIPLGRPMFPNTDSALSQVDHNKLVSI